MHEDPLTRSTSISALSTPPVYSILQLPHTKPITPAIHSLLSILTSHQFLFDVNAQHGFSTEELFHPRPPGRLAKLQRHGPKALRRLNGRGAKASHHGSHGAEPVPGVRKRSGGAAEAEREVSPNTSRLLGGTKSVEV